VSWSRSTSGTPQAVIAAAEEWARAVALVDAEFAPPTVAHRHREQIGRVVETIKTFADRVPAGYHMIVSASGEADVLSSDRYRVSLDAYVPLPNVPRPTTVTARIIEDPDGEC
jgi:hypothetical protein